MNKKKLEELRAMVCFRNAITVAFVVNLIDALLEESNEKMEDHEHMYKACFCLKRKHAECVICGAE